MQTERATALAAMGPAAPDGPGEGARLVTAESFRQLTAKLRAGKATPPSVPDNVIPLRKVTPRQAQPDPVPETEPVPELVSAPEPEPVPEPPAAALPEAPAESVAIPLPASEPERVMDGTDAGEGAGETAISLLELMAATTGLLPQERALAADTLLLLLPRIPVRQLVRLAERVAIMDNPPPLLVERLIRDPRPEVMGPVLERNANVCDRDMIAATSLSDVERLRMIAKRRTLSPMLSGHVAASGDPDVILALLRNGGAELPHQCFAGLCQLAVQHPVLLAPLATRAELPPEAAFELYWNLPPELRRLMASRFLTDSGTLGRILRIALTEDSVRSERPPLDEAPIDAAAFDAAFEAAAAGDRMDDAVRRFAALGGITEGTARRILTDQQGDPTAVLFKAMGVSRTRFVEALESLVRTGALEPGESQDLQAVFDGLSFTKARLLLTYWDWFTRKAGPYESWTVAQVEPAAPC